MIVSVVGQSTCNGAGGGASVVVTGGTTPYTYAWSDGTTGSSLSGLTNGTFTVTVTDAGNTTVSQIVVISNSIVSLNLSSNVAICNGQSTQLTATGASIYAWSPPTGLSNDTISNPLANPTVTTTYTLSGSATSGQLVTNGNFNFANGNTGFNSAYVYVSPAANAASSGGNHGLFLEGTYAVDTDANIYHPSFIGHDLTTGHGKFHDHKWLTWRRSDNLDANHWRISKREL